MQVQPRGGSEGGALLPGSGGGTGPWEQQRYSWLATFIAGRSTRRRELIVELIGAEEVARLKRRATRVRRQQRARSRRRRTEAAKASSSAGQEAGGGVVTLAMASDAMDGAAGAMRRRQ